MTQQQRFAVIADPETADRILRDLRRALRNSMQFMAERHGLDPLAFAFAVMQEMGAQVRFIDGAITARFLRALADIVELERTTDADRNAYNALCAQFLTELESKARLRFAPPQGSA